MKFKLIFSGFIGLLFFSHVNAFEFLEIVQVKAGDNEALINAVKQANAGGDFDTLAIDIIPGDNGETGFEFTQGYNGSNHALPVITGRVVFRNFIDRENTLITYTGSSDRDFRFLKIEASGSASFQDSNIRDFGLFGDNGGAILVTGNGRLAADRSRFENNFSGMNGGAIASRDTSYVFLPEVDFVGNRASNLGGAISIEGTANGSVGLDLRGGGRGNVFRNNEAGVFGCDLNIQTTEGVSVAYNVFQGGNCQNVLIENPLGRIKFIGNTVTHPGNAIDSTDLVRLFGNLFQGPNPPGQLKAGSVRAPKTEAACNDFGSGAFVSDGFNISDDAGCSLTQSTDQPNTDPMFSLNEDGLPVLDPGSPAIDAGSAEVYAPDSAPLALLPCGYVDINGVARPQDGNGDGNFECDSGASEFPGTGDIQAGHSGAFFNALRNGEGNYVEILSDSTAVVYTFSFRPDGSGPAWFIGVGDVRDNSIVIDDLLRPIGTSFGSGFDAEAIDFSDQGSMSVVFSDCNAVGLPGSVAYTGNEEAGYEGLLSRTQRITSITGCDYTPTANAGLSGSFFDPSRNGEGLIIEWLENGDVIAIFFTYDQNGDQFWTFGVGTPTGKSVTINALYPAASTVWGRNFKPEDVDLQSWGTFDLTWSDCDSLTFDYDSIVSGYGSGSLNYIRVSTLQNTSCPSF